MQFPVSLLAFSAAVLASPVSLQNNFESLEAASISKRGDCSVQPKGASSAPKYSPDCASAFSKSTAFGAVASKASTPSGYDRAFVNLAASNNADGYLAYITLQQYDTKACAARCDKMKGCQAVNIYYERSPSLDPGLRCKNPSSVTLIKCAFYSAPISSKSAVNKGQYREKFQVAIAGSNGYVKKSATAPGYSPPSTTKAISSSTTKAVSSSTTKATSSSTTRSSAAVLTTTTSSSSISGQPTTTSTGVSTSSATSSQPSSSTISSTTSAAPSTSSTPTSAGATTTTSSPAATSSSSTTTQASSSTTTSSATPTPTQVLVNGDFSNGVAPWQFYETSQRSTFDGSQGRAVVYFGDIDPTASTPSIVYQTVPLIEQGTPFSISVDVIVQIPGQASCDIVIQAGNDNFWATTVDSTQLLSLRDLRGAASYDSTQFGMFFSCSGTAKATVEFDNAVYIYNPA